MKISPKNSSRIVKVNLNFHQAPLFAHTFPNILRASSHQAANIGMAANVGHDFDFGQQSFEVEDFHVVLHRFYRHVNRVHPLERCLH